LSTHEIDDHNIDLSYFLINNDEDDAFLTVPFGCLCLGELGDGTSTISFYSRTAKQESTA